MNQPAPSLETVAGLYRAAHLNVAAANRGMERITHSVESHGFSITEVREAAGIEADCTPPQAIDARDEPLRDQLATIIQRNHVERRTSDETAREIVRLLMTIPPRKLFLGLCADPCDDC